MNTQLQKEIYDRLNTFFPDENDKLKAISTSLGSAAIMTMFLSTLAQQLKMRFPDDVVFAMGITSRNMLCLTSYLEEIKMQTYPILETLNEQDMEVVYRRIREVSEDLIQMFRSEQDGRGI